MANFFGDILKGAAKGGTQILEDRREQQMKLEQIAETERVRTEGLKTTAEAKKQIELDDQLTKNKRRAGITQLLTDSTGTPEEQRAEVFKNFPQASAEEVKGIFDIQRSTNLRASIIANMPQIDEKTKLLINNLPPEELENMASASDPNLAKISLDKARQELKDAMPFLSQAELDRAAINKVSGSKNPASFAFIPAARIDALNVEVTELASAVVKSEEVIDEILENPAVIGFNQRLGGFIGSLTGQLDGATKEGAKKIMFNLAKEFPLAGQLDEKTVTESIPRVQAILRSLIKPVAPTATGDAGTRLSENERKIIEKLLGIDSLWKSPEQAVTTLLTINSMVRDKMSLIDNIITDQRYPSSSKMIEMMRKDKGAPPMTKEAYESFKAKNGLKDTEAINLLAESRGLDSAVLRNKFQRFNLLDN
jgi:hypothetical protein